MPNETLGRIWFLADTKQRGALDGTEFIIAMHLLTSFKSGAMRGIPQTLPPGLYEAAARRGRPSVGSRPGVDVPPVPAIPKQFTGPQRTQSPINRQQFGSPLSAQGTGGDWLISPQEKAHFDSIFATVDTAKLGMISGDQAVSFFMNAQLPEETLAQIWDLADIDADGQLTKDEFAVAMYLVRQQRSGKEPMPQVLPPALIPPSMRRQATGETPPSAAPAAPAPAPAPPAPKPPSAADDLFGLDAFTAPPPAAPSQVAQSTGGSNGPFHTPGSPAPRQQSTPSPSTTFKPFVPTSSFGQSLQPQATGTPSAAPTQSPPPEDDLLGDNDPEESSKLTQETTELANLSNQIGSLANEMQNVQAKRTSAEQNLSQTSQQKRDFEARLAQARSMYEEEVKNFKALEERLNASRAETNKLQQEYALIDGSRQDLQNQYDQVSAGLTADQQENASLKEKIRQANSIVAQLKPALEKARSDARQQKGLVAINKKQLATVEGERDKMQEEMSGLTKEQPEAAESPAPETGISSPAPEAGAPRVASPAASTTSQNTNPFFKRTMTGSSDNALSPQVSNDHQRAFESFFGPSFTSPSATTPPPPTSFRSESPAVQQPPSKSPTGSAAATPSVTPPPSNVIGGIEAPAPPQSRQITPNALPLGESQSGTSSTVVSPPGSRYGGTDTSAAASATPPAGREHSSTSPSVTGAAAAQSPFDEVQESSARFPEVHESATDESGKPATPANDEAQGKDPSFDELFGGPARKRSQSQNANDFEEAFASMKPSENKTNGTSAAAASEFPPLREFDNDDDSTDSEGPMGFDDNFTPVAPTKGESQNKTSSIDSSQLAAFPVPGTAGVTGQPSAVPPTAEAQKSPPKYDESESMDQGNVPQYNGLLPRRSDPTISPDAPHSVESSTGAPVVHGEPQHEAGKDSPAAPAAGKNGKPDFDAAFAGLDLAPAKEAEDDDDDDTQDNNKNTDFDFSFDAPSQPKAAPSKTQTSSDFFNFDSNVQTPSPSPGTSTQPATSTATNHDWDALFAPLDNPTVPGGWPNGSNTAPSQTADNQKEPGWALNTDTGEDDQILQRLTGMGFPREQSVDALEKFDYNIDKVCLVPVLKCLYADESAS